MITIIFKFYIYECSVLLNDVSNSAWDDVGLRQFHSIAEIRRYVMYVSIV